MTKLTKQEYWAYFSGVCVFFFQYFFIAAQKEVCPENESSASLFIFLGTIPSKLLFFYIDVTPFFKHVYLIISLLSYAMMNLALFCSLEKLTVKLLVFTSLTLAGISVSFAEMIVLKSLSRLSVRSKPAYSAGTGACGLGVSFIIFIMSTLSTPFKYPVALSIIIIIFMYLLMIFNPKGIPTNDKQNIRKRKPSKTESSKYSASKAQTAHEPEYAPADVSEREWTAREKIKLLLGKLHIFFFSETLNYLVYTIATSFLREKVSKLYNKNSVKVKNYNTLLYLLNRVGVFLVRQVSMFYTPSSMLALTFFHNSLFTLCCVGVSVKFPFYIFSVLFLALGVTYGYNNPLSYLQITKRCSKEEAKVGIGLESLSNQIGAFLGALVSFGLGEWF